MRRVLHWCTQHGQHWSTGRKWYTGLDTLDAAIGERELDAALTALASARGMVRTLAEGGPEGGPSQRAAKGGPGPGTRCGATSSTCPIAWSCPCVQLVVSMPRGCVCVCFLLLQPV